MPFATTAFRAMGLTTLAVLLPATAATAHPFITDGATVPAGSLTTMTIEMGHGCGSEGEGGGDPTLEVALQVPDEVSYIEPRDTDGYEASVETDANDRPEVVVWTATDGGVAAPAVPMDIIIDGAEGDEVFLKVFQGCEGFEYRWIGTPDEPADQPAVALTLGPTDPDSPPPAVPEPDGDSEAGNEADQAPAPGLPDDASEDDNVAGTEPDQATTPDPSDEPSEETTPSSAQALEEPAAESEDSILLPVLGAGLLSVAGIGVLLRRRRRRAASSGQEAG